ncbi:MAG: hypothetical protein ACE5HZ_09150 [Fidelibacterota bacterium]
MVRLALVAVILIVIVLYANRKRLKAFSYRIRSVFQNPAVRGHLMKTFFYSLGRITRIALLRRFFRL